MTSKESIAYPSTFYLGKGLEVFVDYEYREGIFSKSTLLVAQIEDLIKTNFVVQQYFKESAFLYNQANSKKPYSWITR